MKSMMMIMATIFAVCGIAEGAYTYTYGPGTNFYSLSLTGTESILVNGGGGNSLDLFNHTLARVEDTTPLSHPYQSGNGIPEIVALAYSTLTITGGEIGELNVGDYSHVTISGGIVEYLYGTLIPPVPAVPENKYIQFICKSYAYNPGTKRMTGAWEDNSLFNIQLVDTAPYPSTFESINFTIVPEPLTLGLLALGGVLVRRHRRAG